MLEKSYWCSLTPGVDWIEAAEVLKKLRHSSAQVDDDHSADEGNV